jgi:hypothetical protein
VRRGTRTSGSKRAIVSLACGVICALLAACGGDDLVAGKGYELTAPEGWEEVDVQEARNVAGTDAVLEGGAVDGFRVNVRVVRETNLGPDLSLGRYLGLSLWSLRDPRAIQEKLPSELKSKDLGPRPQVVGPPKRIELGDRDAYTIVADNRTGGRDFRQRFALSVRGGVGYLLVFTSPVDEFRDQSRAFEEILDSWRWT